MSSLRDIKRRIKSVKNTQQITKAMKMVSAAKLRRAQEEITAARPYADRMLALIKRLASKTSPDSHPLLTKQGGGRMQVVLITSDRGLCGSYNASLIRRTERFLSEKSESTPSLYLIGRKGTEYFKRRSVDVVKTTPMGSARPGYSFAREIAKDMIRSYVDEGLEETYIIFGEFKSALTQRPVVQRVLPIPVEEETEEAGGEIIFEPSEAGVLDRLLPSYVEVQVFRALLESSASEHGARMTAMDSASKNASEMISSLTLTYNRLRQAAITKELMEIIGGAEALKG